MELSLDNVKRKFCLYSGEDPLDTGSRGLLWSQLCVDCLEKAESLLRAGDQPGEREAGILESWAAAEAFYQLALSDEALSPGTVSADGVQVVPADRSKKAKELAAEKRRAAAAVLGEEAFYFGMA